MEDWKIFNLISNSLNKTNLFDNFSTIRKLALQDIPMFSGIDNLPLKSKGNNPQTSSVYSNEKIQIKPIDYYYSNAIARASKTMSDCRVVGVNNKKNGTNN